MSERVSQYEGHCSVCGEWTHFNNMSPHIRETYQCFNCRASMRERVTAEAILTVYCGARHHSLASLVEDEEFRKLRIYEPGVSGAYRPYLGKLDNYENSFYWEGLQAGEKKDGVCHQDLMCLSFEDESFDLVISCDIFEHVRKPLVGFRELKRILKPNGFHIFSIPSLIPMAKKTVWRVDTSTGKDQHLKEPHYHGDGRGGSSLVYTDFGCDIFEMHEELGFRLFSQRADHTDPERIRINAFIASVK